MIKNVITSARPGKTNNGKVGRLNSPSVLGICNLARKYRRNLFGLFVKFLFVIIIIINVRFGYIHLCVYYTS